MRAAAVLVAALLVSVGLLWLSQPTAHADEPQTINAVIGDRSWRRLGRGDLEDATPRERVEVHLRYVLEQLERNPPPDLEPGQLVRREQMLAALERYIDEGRFPRNDTFEGTRPRLADPDGNLCAVAYLIAEAWGHDVAMELVDRWEWAYIDEIDDPRLDAFGAVYGFTDTELATIQPSYPWEPPHPCCVILPPPPPPPPTTTDTVMQSAWTSIQACLSTPIAWDDLTWFRSVTVVLSTARGGSVVASVRSSPADAGVERCVSNTLADFGLFGVPLGRTTVHTVLNPLPEPWIPPPPPPWEPPPYNPPPRVTALSVLQQAPWQIDACRLGPPDAAAWTVTFAIADDGGAGAIRARPDDAVGACLVEVVERTDFSAADERGAVSVRLNP